MLTSGKTLHSLRYALILLNIHGLPSAPLPIIMASQFVFSNIIAALCSSTMSPFAITGISTAFLTFAIIS